MNSEDLKAKKIGILGYGIEGKAVAEYLEKLGIKYKVYDKKDNPEYLSAAVSESEIIFRSPGIKALEPDLISAQKNGVIVTSQIRYFFENCPAKIIGVTGTKGKGTTSKLIFDILQEAGVPSFLAGNIGMPAIGLLETLEPDEYVVLELSSFQLQDIQQSPNVAVVLMVVPEHLDYHEDLEEYVQSKANITRYQKDSDFAVINYDYPLSNKVGKVGSAKKYEVQTLPTEKVEINPFKIYSPEDHLEIKNGVYSEELHGSIYLVNDGQLSKFMDIKDIPLRGFHNTENISAAIMVSKILGIKDATIQNAIRSYKGLEHRLEFVAEYNRIKFYNDSIGTTPESSLAAIKAFSEPEIVILGGADKKVDYKLFSTELCKQKNIKAVILIGEIGPRLKDYLEADGFAPRICSGAESMIEVFRQVSEIAESGDIVLLAPGTSSFGMFKDYKDRGNQFRELANSYNNAS